MALSPKQYPDISEILAQKAAGRRHNAALTFAAKLDRLDELRALSRGFSQARARAHLTRTVKHAAANAAGPIAAFASTNRAATEALLANVAARLSASGAKVVGVLADTSGVTANTCAAGILRDITSTQPFSIRLDAPPSHTSCLLDSAGVAAACRAVLDHIDESDVVVLSKFGKLEANGSGLLPAFEAAMKRRKPLLTSVSGLHRSAWKAFAPAAADLSADEATLLDWCRGATAR